MPNQFRMGGKTYVGLIYACIYKKSIIQLALTSYDLARMLRTGFEVRFEVLRIVFQFSQYVVHKSK